MREMIKLIRKVMYMIILVSLVGCATLAVTSTPEDNPYPNPYPTSPDDPYPVPTEWSPYPAPISPTQSATPGKTPAMIPTVPLIPTRTLSPTPTDTVTPTFTQSPPTPTLYVLSGTPLPTNLPKLIPGNAGRASALARWKLTAVTALTWVPAQPAMAVSDGDAIFIIDLLSRETLRTLHPQVKGIMDLAFSPDGGWLMAGSRQGSEQTGYSSGLELWRGPEWEPRGLLYGTERGLSSLVFSPDGHHLATAFSSIYEPNNSLDIWNTQTWEITRTLKTGVVLETAFSPDSRLLAYSPDRYAIKIWNMVKKGVAFRFPTSFSGAVTRLAFSPDNRYLVSGHYDGTLRLWDVQTGTQVWEQQVQEVIECLAFSPDGQLIATGGSFQSSLIRLWETKTGALLRTLEGHSRGVSALVFAPGGEALATGSYDGEMRLWGVRP